MHATQDSPGPRHAPLLSELAIDGALSQVFPTVHYDHGALTELHNSSWTDMFGDPIEHMYILDNPGGLREEWYEHRIVTDRYVLLAGSLTVALFDARQDSASFGTQLTLQLHGVGNGGTSGLVIPPFVWHSFRVDSERVLLLNAKTPGYDHVNPDKFRMPMPNDLTPFVWPE